MQILGIQLDKPFLRAALIEKSRKGTKLLCLKTATISEPEDVKQLYIPSFKGKKISGLSAKNLMVRPLQVKSNASRHLEEIVAFQSEATSHFQSSEILSVPHFLKKDSRNKSEVLLFTAPRSAIQDHLFDLDHLQFDPDIVSAASLALLRYIQWKTPGFTDAFIVDLGSSEWTCIYIEKGRLKKSYSIEGGIESLLSALWEDRKKTLFQREVEGFAKQIDLIQLKPHLNPNLSAKLGEMRTALSKVIFSFHRSSGLKPILFTGRIDTFGHFREFLSESLKDFICGECNRALPMEELKFAVPIGLALECGDHPLQFRREEFFPKKNWKRVGAYCLSLAVASFLIASSLVFAGKYRENKKMEEMTLSLQSSLERWDPALKQAIFSNNESSEKILEAWSQAVAAHSKESPYLLQAPKVTEVLSWINDHPVISALKKEKDPLEIISFQYQLLQFPKIEAEDDPYQAKVEVEFKTKSPMNARKFHEALLEGDERVDSTQEIGWETLNDSYRASFFLKNRSPYVP